MTREQEERRLLQVQAWTSLATAFEAVEKAARSVSTSIPEIAEELHDEARRIESARRRIWPHINPWRDQV